ncbi:ABC transporter ATP-binding protein/permease [Lentilactobacillus farraginis]|uniref:Transporter n=1 Tax=Lentilactobacillus farraginis DSM 18382 = JCM 14108 TaxID=1423743 RepID=X0QDJ9_9LACO|nr:ABC transporter ATP-binding protein/permease [Lentilactobacillus farraginis]KRM09253.1 ABC superfamily ATP binding cassette transporter, ABC membrane protein [Lentilactobacillus farraginis DSM 18382 = JCM 14108]GAF36700.1 transporter [Lentilactobacillus farraginis DSM 18382 = JCM 14108]
MAYLELHDIKKSYYLGSEEFPVLKGLDLSFEQGEFVSILGESGGGKTTLMNIIGGLDSNYTGDVVLNGNSLRHDTNKQLDAYRRQTIGFIFQNFNLISHLTVLQNVMVSLEMTTLNRKQQEERARQLLDQVGLKEHVKKYPNQLSGGQKQRVAIARALASDPEIIIADEPTGALDSQNTQEILELLDQIATDGKLVITVTHSQTVANYGTRIVRLTDGKISEDKQLKEPYRSGNENELTTHTLKFGATLKMALENMKYNLKRNILIVVGAAIGIFSVIVMLGLGNGVQGYINHEIYSQVNPNALQITKNVSSDSSDMDKINMQTKDKNRLNRIKHVKNVQDGYYVQGGSQLRSGKKTAAISFMQTFNPTILKKSITKGTAPKNGEILLTKEIAAKLNKKHPYSLIGKKITFYQNTLNKQKRPVTLSKTLTVSGVAKANTGSTSITYQTMKSIYNTKKISIKPNFLTLEITGSVKNVKPVQNKIKAYKNGKHKQLYTITGVGGFVDTLNTYINLAVNVLATIAGISLLVSAIMIIVVLYISVSERTKEIGILRALGASKGSIRNLFFSEAFFIGLFSSILAIGLAEGLAAVANHIAQSGIHYQIMQISAGNLLFGLLVSIVISLLAALAPAGKAARLDPIESLSYE